MKLMTVMRQVPLPYDNDSLRLHIIDELLIRSKVRVSM